MSSKALTASQTEVFLPYMRDVGRCERSLQELNLMWRIIEASAKMNCPQEARAILPTMAATRSSFSLLEKELVQSLVHQKVSHVLTEIGTTAQYVIDIVVRNLFERTADVGFLATDRELCSFVAGLHEERGLIHHRLCEYRNKYTVYDEIILLDTQGHVLAQIDPTTPLEHSADPLLRQTLDSDQYVETFRASDLRPNKRKALIYSRRMHHPDTGAVVGVLCLCFHFEEEMAGIFQSHGDPAQRTNLLLLDDAHQVIASADPNWIPVGVKVPVNLDQSPHLFMYAGREYLVRTFSSAGYQGYPGPKGWLGQAMIPLDVAFSSQSRDLVSGLDPLLLDGLLSHADRFCPPLHDIVVAARHIQRIVWNGQVMTAGQQGDMQKLKTVLEQISETGNRSNELFEHSIHDLYQTVLGSSLLDAEFTAHLLVDLLDRNLYERSDDCRWWALSPELRQALADQPPDAAQRMQTVLDTIHALYTVYTSLFVYDHQGRILAATSEAGQAFVGQFLGESDLAAVRRLASPQHYHVSPFENTPWYGGEPSYVYHAAIRHPEHEDQIVGGIGIVFDSGPELHNMLLSGLGGREHMQALFVNRQGRVLSSTSPDHPAGSTLSLPATQTSLANGQSHARICTHQGEYAIEACSVSNGYREFKTVDGYRDDVIAVVYRHFGEVRQGRGALRSQDCYIEHDSSSQGGLEFATFFCDGNLMALPAECVQEAVSFREVRTTSMGLHAGQVGILGLRDSQSPQGKASFIWVFDLGQLLHGRRSEISSNSQVMILRHGTQALGLLVDELHAVTPFEASALEPSPLALQSQSMLTRQVIKANEGRLLIQAVDADRLFSWLMDGIDPNGAEPTDAPAGDLADDPAVSVVA
ncbi:chemotaxis protein CheW [Curvibacter sp. HBC61]|uniref:Chemotaxis protein CheW n=1 Tax=Curvibacter cyanobacteriorum TaxID=3026422 RepID=A0ABT5N3W1_9BURK|nr:chemotaxis protein CheW [Curvibacter sp. HBC61]MDD0839767.1 chemotaxis protein CheW [Curvibacter sp. HBC61]